MTPNRTHIILLSLTLVGWLLFDTSLSVWEATALGFSLFALLNFLHELGNSIAIRELIVFTAALTMAFSPALVFINRPEDVILSSEDYLSYGLPATIAFSFGMLLRLKKHKPHKDILNQVKVYLIGKEKGIITLIVLGLVGQLFVDYMPVEIRAIVNLCSVTLYTAVLYCHFVGGRYKYYILSVALFLLLYQTIQQGMFGNLLHCTALYFCVTLVSRPEPISFRYKILIATCGVLFIIVAQSIKMEYRFNTWGASISERKADPSLMFTLIADRLNNTDYLFGDDHIYATYNRTNQGVLISEAMYYVPRYEPFANGEILLHLLYPFIPRFIWNDKPITGGIANIERYTRFVHMGTSSSNISPLGEAYVNFGRVGGIIFMFLFGLLLNSCFTKIVQLAEQKSSIILWLPLLFLGCMTLETDILTVWGSFVIMAVYVIFLWSICKRFNINL